MHKPIHGQIILAIAWLSVCGSQAHVPIPHKTHVNTKVYDGENSVLAGDCRFCYLMGQRALDMLMIFL